MIFTDIVRGFYLVAPEKWQAKFTKESTNFFRNLDCSYLSSGSFDCVKHMQ